MVLVSLAGCLCVKFIFLTYYYYYFGAVPLFLFLFLLLLSFLPPCVVVVYPPYYVCMCVSVCVSFRN